MSLRFKTSTTANTNMDTAATKRNINLSVMDMGLRDKNQEIRIKNCVCIVFDSCTFVPGSCLFI
jgi:hypothetical protein